MQGQKSPMARLFGSPMAWLVALVPAVMVAVLRRHDGPGITAEDYAQYLLHAKALVEGRAYVDTGYLWTPYAAFHSPLAMPPGVPVLLAAVFALTGYSVAVAHGVMVVALLLFALWSGMAVSREIGRPGGLAVALLVPLSVLAMQCASAANSDLPFAAAVWAVVLLLDRPGRMAWGRAAAITVVGGFAMASRTVGVILLPTVAVVVFARRRELGRIAFVPVAAWCVAGVVALALKPRGGSLLGAVVQLFGEHGPVWRSHLHRLRIFGSETWLYPFPVGWANDVWHVAAAGLAIAGLLAMVRATRHSAGLAFGVLYAGVLFVLPFSQGRYFLPLAPLLLAGLWQGGVLAMRPLANRRPRAARMLAVLCTLVLAVGGVRTLLKAPRLQGLGDIPEVRALFDTVRAEERRAPQRAMFARPRVLTLDTGVPAMPTFTATADQTVAELRRRCITLVVQGGLGQRRFSERSVEGTLRWRGDLFELIWSNEAFRLFRFDPGADCASRLRRP